MMCLVAINCDEVLLYKLLLIVSKILLLTSYFITVFPLCSYRREGYFEDYFILEKMSDSNLIV